MDPFAPDSDPEEDSEQHPLSHSQRAGVRKSVTSRRERSISMEQPQFERKAIEDEDDEEPPASILIDYLANRASNGPMNTNATSVAQDGVHLHQSTVTEAGPSRLGESVRLGSLSRQGNIANLYQDNEEDGSEAEEERLPRDVDEEAGLLNDEPRQSSASSSSSSSKRRKEKGIFSTFVRKVKKKAERIQAESGVAGSGQPKGNTARGLNPRERALWEWGTRENMDEFLQEVREVAKPGIAMSVLTFRLSLKLGVCILCGKRTILHCPDQGIEFIASRHMRIC